ncbi:hypothetical protein GCM10023078_19500 [Gibbsiella greigii]
MHFNRRITQIYFAHKTNKTVALIFINYKVMFLITDSYVERGFSAVNLPRCHAVATNKTSLAETAVQMVKIYTAPHEGQVSAEFELT